MWRARKENGSKDPELQKGRHVISEQLGGKTGTTLSYAKRKLYVREQLESIRIIFGGGGHCDHPYKTGVMEPFHGNIFVRNIEPDIVGLPIPRDIELGAHGSRWMRRLSVAYGLSFTRQELVDFTYPKDVSNPQPSEIWKQVKVIPGAPTKDVC
jgi:hypothetical protein